MLFSKMGRGLPLFFVHTASRAHGPDSQTMQTSIVRVPGISRDLQGLPQDPHPSFWPVSSASPPKRNDKLARRRWRHGPVLTLLLCAFELGLPKTVEREREGTGGNQNPECFDRGAPFTSGCLKICLALAPGGVVFRVAGYSTFF